MTRPPWPLILACLALFALSLPLLGVLLALACHLFGHPWWQWGTE